MTRSGIDGVRSLVSSKARTYAGLRVRQLGSVAVIACAEGRSAAEHGQWHVPNAGDLHYCTDAENTLKTCHFLPLFEVRGGQRVRKRRAVCRIGTRGSELALTWSGDSKKKWHRREGKWQCESPRLFTISRGRAEGGNQGGGAGRNTHSEGTNSFFFWQPGKRLCRSF
jgi:hypothetical protein